MAMTMTISNNSSAKRVTVQIPTLGTSNDVASRDRFRDVRDFTASHIAAQAIVSFQGNCGSANRDTECGIVQGVDQGADARSR